MPRLLIVWLNVLFVLFTAITVSVLAGVEPINFDRIHLIDYSARTNTYLFRGNLPETLNPPVFAYDTLVMYLKNRSASEGVQYAAPALTGPFDLYIITFLNHTDPTEIDALNTEFNFAGNNKNLITELVWWELGGDSVPPASLTPIVRTFSASVFPIWDYDRLSERIDWLHEKVHGLAVSGNVTTPSVWYFHCGHGQDRTGEVAGAYNMRWMNQTYAQVLAYNEVIGMDVPQNLNAMEWYGLWLNATRGV